MSHLDSLRGFVTDQDRDHCRLDLNAVGNASDAMRFVLRWRRSLEGFLLDFEKDELADELKGTLGDIGLTLGRLQDEASAIARSLSDVADAVDDLGRGGRRAPAAGLRTTHRELV